MVALNRKNALRFTTHASIRCQQRGLDGDAVQSVLTHGKEYHAGDGSKAYFLGKRAVIEAKRRYGIDLDRWRDTAVIVSKEDAIITVQHVARPKRSWRGRH